MNKLKYLICLFVLTYSCKEQEEKKAKPISYMERAIKQALLNGYFTKVNKNIGVSIYQDHIFILSSKQEGFSNKKFMFHLVNKNHSFENNDFSKEKFLLTDSLKGDFSKLSVIHQKINIEPYEELRIGQYSINNDKTKTNIWSKQILVDDILQRKQQYSNEYESVLNTNLLHIAFKSDLTNDKFFKTKSNFYILLSDTAIYFITRNDIRNKKIMLHFVNEDNSFSNKSFNFDNQNHHRFLKPPYSNLRIAKISLPVYDEFYKIRIGQYNDKGNIWAQEVVLEEIYSNELLKYDNEFEMR